MTECKNFSTRNSHLEAHGKIILMGVIVLYTLILMSFTSAVWTADLNTNLTAYYPLDETSGTKVASFNGLNNGTSHNTTIVNGIIGKALLFNGVDSWVNISRTPYTFDFINTSTQPTRFTINFWTYVNETGHLNWIIASNGSTYSAYLLGGTSYGSSTYSSTPGWDLMSGSSFGDFPTGRWEMRTLVANRTGWFSYINGSFNSSMGSGNITVNGSGDLIFGSAQGFSTWFNGTLDEVGFWDTDLNYSSINQLWNNGEGSSPNQAFQVYSILNNPKNGANVIKNDSIVFDCSAYGNNNGTNYITNVSLETNETGSWIVNQTKIPTSSQNASFTSLGYLNMTFDTYYPQSSLSWTCLVCQSDNVCGSSTLNYSLPIFSYIINNETYTNTTYSGTSETFTLNVNITNTDSLNSVYLYYNKKRLGDYNLV